MTPGQQAYAAYLKSDHWRELRAVVLARDGYRCTRCPCRQRLQAHHLKYRAKFEDSQPEDLITLCNRCHKLEHGIIQRQPRPKKFKQKHKTGLKARRAYARWQNQIKRRNWSL